MSVAIAQIAPRDRPRERLGRFGAAALTDAELVALVVRSGGRGCSALQLGDGLLANHGGLAGLASVQLLDLSGVPSLGRAKASSLIAAFELGRRAAAADNLPVGRVRGLEDVARLASSALKDPGREEVIVVIVNRAMRLLGVENLTLGTDDRCLVDVRDVLSVVLKRGGVGFAVAHSHPSGDPTPSAEDAVITTELKEAAKAVGLRFLSHVVLAGKKWAEVH